MTKIIIRETQNPAILKFEFPEFITQNESFEYKNIDEAKNSPLVQQLFYLPFVKSADYLGMNYLGYVHYNADKEEETSIKQINFLQKR